MNNYQVLIDSDAFVSLFVEHDYFYPQAAELFSKFTARQAEVATTDWVIAESATVISNRVGQDQAQKFLRHLDASHLPILHINEDLVRETREFFMSQPGRGISMVDCSNAVVMARFSIPTIFSFDQFYTKRLKLKVAQ